jgi:hypothetical protein
MPFFRVLVGWKLQKASKGRKERALNLSLKACSHGLPASANGRDARVMVGSGAAQWEALSVGMSKKQDESSRLWKGFMRKQRGSGPNAQRCCDEKGGNGP